MNVTFQKESFIRLMPELPEIFYKDWLEVALDHDVIPLDPDWDRYALFELQGYLHVMTVRDAESKKLVGYYIAIVMPHLHYKSSKTAWSDIIYILPEYREDGRGLKSVGQLLIEETEKMLRELQVQKSYLVTKKHLPITILVKRLKYRFIEMVFTKLL